MDLTRAWIALVGIMCLMWIGGCQSARPQTQNPSMTRIWELRQRQQHRTLVEEVDRLVKEGRGAGHHWNSSIPEGGLPAATQ